MNKTELFNSVSRSVHKVGFKFKKHSPEILIVAGVIGTVAGVVTACRATLKVNEIVEDTKNDIEKIHEAVENGVTEAGKDYSEQDAKKDLTAVYAQTGVKFVKLYGPSALLLTLSLGSMVKSNSILRKRNLTLLAAYTAVDKSFKQYRNRVVERFGEDMDKELRLNIKAKEIEETTTTEDGTEVVTKKTVNVVDQSETSGFARIFDDGCNGWTKDPSLNLVFLKQQERYANEKLKKDGYLFLNEVYEMLGFPRCPIGQVAGWIYDEKHPNGDNFVSFGITDDVYNERKRAFINGWERNILLDFNVDGPIIDLI